MKLPLPSTCEGCPLYGPDKGFSILEGDGSSGLMIIAESLGYHEERASLPLRSYAPSGGVFQKALKITDLLDVRRTATITNTIRCRAEAPYPRAALDQCRQYLDAAVAERRPRFILALGDVPLQELSLMKLTQAEARGFVIPSRYDCPMLATFHPSRIARGDWRLLGILKHDIAQAVRFTAKGVPERRPTHYLHDPTDSDIRDYLRRLEADPSLPISYDCETPELIGQQSDGKTIMLMQFSAEAGTGMALTPDRLDACRLIMATPNPKWGWAERTFDRPLLRANGFTLGGEFHDLMAAHAHNQPDLMSNKDETSGEKGIPARLMSLQSCVSLYEPWELPWKQMVREFRAMHPDADPMPTVKEYGIKDVDFGIRVGERIFAAQHRYGTHDSYRRHKFQLSGVLDFMQGVGIPVDAQKQAELRDQLETQEQQLTEQVQQDVPREVKSFKSFKGWPKDLREAVKTAGLYVKNCKPEQFLEFAADLGYEFNGSLVKYLPFNGGSWQQLLRYIKHKGYPVPTLIDNHEKETTGKEGIDQLIAETGDVVLKAVRQGRQLRKMRGTYCEGHWVPGEDGRVHPVFTFGTASGQLTPRRPNSAQFPQHGALAKLAKACIRVEPGHTFIKRDCRSFHARSLGWLSGDAAYYALADEDVHSFVTAHFLRLPVADHLMKMSSDERRVELAKIKRDHKEVRDQKAKRAILGLGFHMGARKLQMMNPEAFPTITDAMALIDLIESLFPRAFKEYPEHIDRRLRQSPRLVSPTNHHRWLWGEDLEQAVSFEPANVAHCHMFDSMLMMHEQGLTQRWQLSNMIHDCLIFHCPNELIDECIEGSREIMERVSTVLVDSPLGAFQCSSDCEIGESMAEMRAI